MVCEGELAVKQGKMVSEPFNYLISNTILVCRITYNANFYCNVIF